MLQFWMKREDSTIPLARIDHNNKDKKKNQTQIEMEKENLKENTNTEGL